MPVDIKYITVKQKLLRQIQAGEYPSGKLPSLRRIAAKHKVNLLTARRAVKELELANVVICRAKQRASIRTPAIAFRHRPDGSGDPAGTQESAIAVKTRVRLYSPAHSPAHRAAWQSVLHAFEHRYPWIEIEWVDTIDGQEIARDARYDVMYVPANDLADYRKRGLIRSIEAHGRADGVVADAYPAAVWRACLLEDELWGVPHYINAPVVFFNERLMNLVCPDIARLNAQRSWDEFRALIGALERAGQGGYSMMAMTQLWTSFHRRFLRNVVMENHVELFRKTVETMKAMAQAPRRLNVHPRDMWSAFKMERLPFIISFSYMLPTLDRDGPFIPCLAPLPLEPQGAATYLLSLHCLGAHTEHTDESWLLLKFLAGADVFRVVGRPMGHVPVHCKCFQDGGMFDLWPELAPIARAPEESVVFSPFSSRVANALLAVIQPPLRDFIADQLDFDGLWATLHDPLRELVTLYGLAALSNN